MGELAIRAAAESGWLCVLSRSRRLPPPQATLGRSLPSFLVVSIICARRVCTVGPSGTVRARMNVGVDGHLDPGGVHVASRVEGVLGHPTWC